MTPATRQVVLVTGAASGIGAACARRFGERGAFVYCADLDLDGATTVAREIGERSARALLLDVTDEPAWDSALATVHERHARLTVLVHAAGVSDATPLAGTTLARWRRVLAVNLDGAFLATRTGIREMGSAGGAVVLIGSASGLRPAAGAAAYSSSKAGLAMLARAAAKECRDAGLAVRINVVSPGGVKTPLWRSMPFFRALVAEHGSEEAAFASLAGSGPPFAEPEDIANAVLFLASPSAAHVTGADLPVDGGYTL